jgi:hypothetical protein
VTSTTELVARMTEALAGASVDLDNERACLRTLIDRKFAEGDIILHIDAAVATAKARRSLRDRMV